MYVGNIKLVKIITLYIFLIKYGSSTSLSKDNQFSRNIISCKKNYRSYLIINKNYKYNMFFSIHITFQKKI